MTKILHVKVVMNLVLGVALALLLLLASSCRRVEQEVVVNSGSGDVALEVNLSVSFSVAGDELGGEFEAAPDGGRDDFGEKGGLAARSIVDPGVGTDEGTAVGYIPGDVWMLQYSGVADDAALVGQPRYTELSGAISLQVVASAVVNTLVFVANTHDANLEFGDISTLGQLKLACRQITRESDCHGDFLFPTKDLIMSGQYQGVITTGAISVKLLRNIVRLDLTLSNGAASGMTLHSVQLCNVPRDFYYTSAIVPSGEVFPRLLECFDYPSEALTEASTEGGSQSFTFYMPANQRGVVRASTSRKTKSAYAPDHSSYFRIAASDAQGQGYVYRIYPGANLVNDYNLSANRRYIVELSVNSAGDPSDDSRVESFYRVDFESSNSFMLKPSAEGSAGRIFTFPIDKVNQFWSGADASLTIGAQDQWTVELIWQDTGQTDFVRFVDLATGATSTTFAGAGPDERFAVKIGPRSKGNALVGLRKVGKESVGYLWSWHLWVSDYDPEYRQAPDYKRFVYHVPGGYVHRYQGAVWTGISERYYTKYVMDRNLGARDADFTTVGVLYYQFGRKDPLPINGYGNMLYDINGQALPNDHPNNGSNRKERAPDGVTLATGVLNPTTMYYIVDAARHSDWTSQGKGASSPWNDPLATIEQKSIFDPCPSGWKLTVYSIWYDFAPHATNPLLSTVLDVRRDKRLIWYYKDAPGIRYWPKNSEIVGTIYYPAVGARYGGSGSVGGVLTTSRLWSGTALSAQLGRDLNSGPANVYISHGDYRVHAFPARCIQQ